MTITTSYYASKLVKAGMIACEISPVSISRYTPKWFKGPSFTLLAPSSKLLLDYKYCKVTEAQYTEIFNDYLDTLNCKDVFESLTNIFGHNATLLCYEKAGDFCHRHLVSKWFNKNLKTNVFELGYKPERRLFEN